MRFTIFMLGTPLAIFALVGKHPDLEPIAAVAAIWFLVSIPLVKRYWQSRVIARARRDGARSTRAV